MIETSPTSSPLFAQLTLPDQTSSASDMENVSHAQSSVLEPVSHSRSIFRTTQASGVRSGTRGMSLCHNSKEVGHDGNQSCLFRKQILGIGVDESLTGSQAPEIEVRMSNELSMHRVDDERA